MAGTIRERGAGVLVSHISVLTPVCRRRREVEMYIHCNSLVMHDEYVCHCALVRGNGRAQGPGEPRSDDTDSVHCALCGISDSEKGRRFR